MSGIMESIMAEMPFYVWIAYAYMRSRKDHSTWRV